MLSATSAPKNVPIAASLPVRFVHPIDFPSGSAFNGISLGSPTSPINSWRSHSGRINTPPMSSGSVLERHIESTVPTLSPPTKSMFASFSSGSPNGLWGSAGQLGNISNVSPEVSPAIPRKNVGLYNENADFDDHVESAIDDDTFAFEEDLVPSSLSDLLTPAERLRRDSRNTEDRSQVDTTLPKFSSFKISSYSQRGSSSRFSTSLSQSTEGIASIPRSGQSFQKYEISEDIRSQMSISKSLSPQLGRSSGSPWAPTPNPLTYASFAGEGMNSNKQERKQDNFGDNDYDRSMPMHFRMDEEVSESGTLCNI
ncbi:hypothetical protein CANCADRAFT_31735 [Tortispora caseinolytica NRRL Y-17796]|uniref:Uncharacterized protein n=1 Tax=Tortispora caseinolytica NRRL Y-17796 TaxID=767744 RepID=A0A1E4TGV4_9ASCO|nr:hypothetical protein CANCADRAFT_31735 [Tortispora caseinolytica NRRL Y-17796]